MLTSRAAAQAWAILLGVGLILGLAVALASIVTWAGEKGSLELWDTPLVVFTVLYSAVWAVIAAAVAGIGPWIASRLALRTRLPQWSRVLLIVIARVLATALVASGLLLAHAGETSWVFGVAVVIWLGIGSVLDVVWHGRDSIAAGVA